MEEKNDSSDLLEDNGINIPLLPFGGEDGYQIRSAYTDVHTNKLSKQVLHITSVLCVLNVFIKVILVIVEAAESDPDYDWAILDLILTTFFCFYLFWAVVEGIKTKNRQFCFMGLLDWYLLVTVTFTTFCLFGVGFGIYDADWKVLVPSTIFFILEAIACAVTCQLISHLYNTQNTIDERDERRRSVSTSSSGDPL
jgi:hypothetical protein